MIRVLHEPFLQLPILISARFFSELRQINPMHSFGKICKLLLIFLKLLLLPLNYELGPSLGLVFILMLISEVLYCKRLFSCSFPLINSLPFVFVTFLFQVQVSLVVLIQETGFSFSQELRPCPCLWLGNVFEGNLVKFVINFLVHLVWFFIHSLVNPSLFPGFVLNLWTRFLAYIVPDRLRLIYEPILSFEFLYFLLVEFARDFCHYSLLIFAFLLYMLPQSHICRLTPRYEPLWVLFSDLFVPILYEYFEKVWILRILWYHTHVKKFELFFESSSELLQSCLLFLLV